MANEELGTKRDCPECGARFYDLGKEPALCPKCGHDFIPEVILKSRRIQKDDNAEATDDEAQGGDGEIEVSADQAPLDEADSENTEAQSARKSALDEEEGDDGDDIPEIEDVDVDIDIDADDDTLLDDEEDDDMGGIVPTKQDDE